MPAGFLKGQLHTHTSGSADSNTSPRDVHRWYEARGYDFVVFTDHNAITDTDDTRLLTIRGAELTRNLRNCEPPPPAGIPCLLHVNALFVTENPGPVDLGNIVSMSRRDIYRQSMKRANELGGVAMLNHPNMQYGADQGLVLELARDGLTLLEVGNQSWDSESAGDATHPSTEAIWDGVLGQGARVFATVTDDAHFYGDLPAARARGERPFPGDLGFVVVRAERNVTSIRNAVMGGDFYGSTGVLFTTYELSQSKLALAIGGTDATLAISDGASVSFEVIGRGGNVLHRLRGPRLDYTLEPTSPTEERPYVRVRATRDDGARAWTQPVFFGSPRAGK